MAVHAASMGIPRTISVICDNALLVGFALQRRAVDKEIIDEVLRDLALLKADPKKADPIDVPATVPPVQPREEVEPIAARAPSSGHTGLHIRRAQSAGLRWPSSARSNAAGGSGRDGSSGGPGDWRHARCIGEAPSAVGCADDAACR